ncbi:hypothetical protein GPECTOR_6g880 [Gonium pectorale]|uniref:Uncharacterized protein n=1 Tax=Gonium pectorale TaxID=33097 RepID=A0A150GVU2_GONPE|nr:hypothetical protein GPECTOR_6g880 [Gonium pectorale]|eukprot:KXZ53961.1 hypothetical protein GPECTOR_6g880 [Gonium pectorale]
MKAQSEEEGVRKVNFATPSGHLDVQSFSVEPLPRNSFHRTAGGHDGAAHPGGLSRCTTGVVSRPVTAVPTTHVAWANSVGTVSGASALSRAYRPSEYGEEEEDDLAADVDAVEWAEGPDYDSWSDDDAATSRTVTGAPLSRTVTGASSAREGPVAKGGRKRLKGHVGTWSVKVLSALRLMPDRRGRLHLPSMVVYTQPRPPLAHRTTASTWWTKVKGWAMAATAANHLNTAMPPTRPGAARSARSAPDAGETPGGASGRLPHPDEQEPAGDAQRSSAPAAVQTARCTADASVGASSAGAASSGMASAGLGFRAVAARALDTGMHALGLGLGAGTFPSTSHDLDCSHRTVSTLPADGSTRGGLQSSFPSVITCDDGSTHRGAVLLFDGNQQQTQVALAYARSARNSGNGAAPVAAIVAAGRGSTGGDGGSNAASVHRPREPDANSGYGGGAGA